MATEKFFVFNEDGVLKRLKGRIVRYLDNEDPSGADKSAIRTSLEVSPDAAGLVQADVGTAPNEVPLNGMLGDMAYQSSDGVSVAELEVTDKIGIGTNSGSRELTIGDGTGSPNIQLLSSNSGLARIEFGDTDDGDAGELMYDHSNNKLTVNTAGSTAVTIDSSQRVGIQDAYPSAADSLTVSSDNASTSLPLSTMMVRNNSNTTGSCAGIAFQARNSAADVCGAFMGAVSQSTYRTADLAIHTRYNGTYGERLRITNSALVLGSGMAIDFGSGATFDNYEHGDITSVTDASGAGLAITADLKYQVIGKSVQISGKIIFPVTADTNAARVTLLPEQCPNDDGARGLSVSYSTIGSAFYVLPLGGTNDVMFYTVSGSTMSNNALSGVAVFISGNYSIN